MNYVITGSGDFVEVQGTAEEKPFNLTQMDAMRTLALTGCAQLCRLQKQVLES